MRRVGFVKPEQASLLVPACVILTLCYLDKNGYRSKPMTKTCWQGKGVRT